MAASFRKWSVWPVGGPSMLESNVPSTNTRAKQAALPADKTRSPCGKRTRNCKNYVWEGLILSLTSFFRRKRWPDFLARSFCGNDTRDFYARFCFVEALGSLVLPPSRMAVRQATQQILGHLDPFSPTSYLLHV